MNNNLEYNLDDIQAFIIVVTTVSGRTTRLTGCRLTLWSDHVIVYESDIIASSESSYVYLFKGNKFDEIDNNLKATQVSVSSHDLNKIYLGNNKIEIEPVIRFNTQSGGGSLTASNKIAVSRTNDQVEIKLPDEDEFNGTYYTSNNLTGVHSIVTLTFESSVEDLVNNYSKNDIGPYLSLIHI